MKRCFWLRYVLVPAAVYRKCFLQNFPTVTDILDKSLFWIQRWPFWVLSISEVLLVGPNAAGKTCFLGFNMLPYWDILSHVIALMDFWLWWLWWFKVWWLQCFGSFTSCLLSKNSHISYHVSHRNHLQVYMSWVFPRYIKATWVYDIRAFERLVILGRSYCFIFWLPEGP